MSQYFIDIYNTVKSMLSGMSITLHHLRKKKDLVATLQYPNEKWPKPDRNIGFEHSDYNVIRSRLHVDIDDCIGCLQCEKVCPVDCIKIDTIKPPKDSDYDCGKTSHDTQKKMIVPRFSIDMSECMYCNLCVYPCPEECIYMVGGPNEPKHDIDYEYSKYVKHDLVFEFSNTTNQDIIDIGGQSYLDKRNNISNKIEKGYNLEGIASADSDGVSKEDKKESKSSKHVDPGFIVFKSVKDKMSRGIAKKAYTYGRRNDMDMVAISKYVEEAIDSYNKMTPDMEEAIKAIINFKYPDEEIQSDVADKSLDSSEAKDSPSTKETGLFNIKMLNDIQDKMIRGSLKKIYMGGTRENKPNNEVVNEMIDYLNKEEKMSDGISDLLLSLKQDESSDTKADNNIEDKKIANKEEIKLFDIKKLNDIEDKMIRGMLKKIYMAGKRNKLSSKEVVDDMIQQLTDSDKMNDDLLKMLQGIL